jgi:hypothetical protein
VLCIADTFTFTPVAFVSLVWHKKDLGKTGKKECQFKREPIRNTHYTNGTDGAGMERMN